MIIVIIIDDELLECIPTIEVDLLSLDMKMPGMYGLKLARRINDRK